MRRPNHASRFEGIAKTNLQASRASDTETLQSQVNKAGKKRLSLSGLEVLHGRLDTSRLVPSCLEHSGRLDPLACQVEIFLTLSGIYRYLGRLNTVLGVVLIKLLQCRHVPGVVVLIMLLQCRYHYHLFIQLLPHTDTRQMASQDIVWSAPAGSTEDACNTRCRLQCRMRSLSRPLAS